MPMKKYKSEQIVTLLWQLEVEIANGRTTPQDCKEALDTPALPKANDTSLSFTKIPSVPRSAHCQRCGSPNSKTAPKSSVFASVVDFVAAKASNFNKIQQSSTSQP
jgi:hypothetical protein